MELSKGANDRRYINKLTTPLALIYEKAYKDLLKQLQSPTIYQEKRANTILNNVKEIVKDLDKETKAYLAVAVPQIYNDFRKESKDILKAGGIKAVNKFTQIHTQAINNLKKEAYLNFANSLVGITRDAEKTISRARKEVIRNIIGSGQIRGAEVAKEVSQELKRSGIVSLIDKGGKKWEIDTYAKMLTQNTLANTAREAQFNTAREYGFDLVQITSHGASDSCRFWEDKIVSLTGETKGYPTLSEVQASGEIFHVNCRHSYFVVVNPSNNEINKSITEKERLDSQGSISNYQAKRVSGSSETVLKELK